VERRSTLIMKKDDGRRSSVQTVGVFADLGNNAM
jgi:hypothetical protein